MTTNQKVKKESSMKSTGHKGNKRSAHRRVLRFDWRVPVYSLKPGLINPLFRLAHRAEFHTPLTLKPN